MGKMRPELYSRSRFPSPFQSEQSRSYQEAWSVLLARPNAVGFANFVLTFRQRWRAQCTEPKCSACHGCAGIAGKTSHTSAGLRTNAAPKLV